ncbi:abortive infection family protein [Profundibacter amoris]|uniref:abortive infection family protein n=1 Tax=Profundibacter amoris TaxID=2171755 RepID=UPI001E47C310|nr:abortive infection family protein [Profundibacter amoris]
MINKYYSDLIEQGIDIPESAFDRATALQNGLIAAATDGSFALENGGNLYKAFRKELIENVGTRNIAPDFLRTKRDLSQFWEHIKDKFPTYAERRKYLYEEFSPLLDYLENSNSSAHETTVGEVFSKFTPGHIPEIWDKALERTKNDPEGAITLARTLLESVCKYILDDTETPYKADANLPKLWADCSTLLNLSPSQHTEDVFKTILGSCQNIVGSLGSLRNKISDSHGQGKRPVKPQTRHAELAVNLAGSMAQFLVSTWENRK